MHQEDRIYTSKEIKGLFILWVLFVGMVDRPKSVWLAQKTSLTHFYWNEDIKWSFSLVQSQDVSDTSFIYGLTVSRSYGLTHVNQCLRVFCRISCFNTIWVILSIIWASEYYSFSRTLWLSGIAHIRVVSVIRAINVIQLTGGWFHDSTIQPSWPALMPIGFALKFTQWLFLPPRPHPLVFRRLFQVQSKICVCWETNDNL